MKLDPFLIPVDESSINKQEEKMEFYSNQTKDYNPGDRLSESSENYSSC